MAEEKKIRQNKAVWAVIGLIVVAALMVGIWVLARPAAAAGAKKLDITVVHGDGTEKTFDIATDAETLDVALVENGIVEDNQSEWGLYILTADGETADESAQQWWCITKGGEMLNTGASDTVIQDGEAYELTLTTGYDG